MTVMMMMMMMMMMMISTCSVRGQQVTRDLSNLYTCVLDFLYQHQPLVNKS